MIVKTDSSAAAGKRAGEPVLRISELIAALYGRLIRRQLIVVKSKRIRQVVQSLAICGSLLEKRRLPAVAVRLNREIIGIAENGVYCFTP